MAAPGAPLIGSAAPENTPPNPSPIHQTPKDHATDTARAVLVLRLQATPSPIPTWIRAKSGIDRHRDGARWSDPTTGWTGR